MPENIRKYTGFGEHEAKKWKEAHDRTSVNGYSFSVPGKINDESNLSTLFSTFEINIKI